MQSVRPRAIDHWEGRAAHGDRHGDSAIQRARRYVGPIFTSLGD